MNKAAMKIHTQVLVWTCFHFLGYTPRNTEAESYDGCLYVAFWGTDELFSKVADQFHITDYVRVPISPLLPNICYCVFFMVSTLVEMK